MAAEFGKPGYAGYVLFRGGCLAGTRSSRSRTRTAIPTWHKKFFVCHKRTSMAP